MVPQDRLRFLFADYRGVSLSQGLNWTVLVNIILEIWRECAACTTARQQQLLQLQIANAGTMCPRHTRENPAETTGDANKIYCDHRSYRGKKVCVVVPNYIPLSSSM